MEHTLYIVGIGPGNPDYVVPRGLKLIEAATVLVGSQRSLDDFAKPGQMTYPVTGKLSELVDFMRKQIESQDIVVMVSGDPGYYSLLPYLKKKFPEHPLEVIPGISSIPFAMARLGETWQDAKLMSFHGRKPEAQDLKYKEGYKVAFLTDNEYNPAKIADILISCGWPKEIKAAAGERLSYSDEHIVKGTLEEMTQLEGFGHSVLVVFG